MLIDLKFRCINEIRFTFFYFNLTHRELPRYTTEFAVEIHTLRRKSFVGRENLLGAYLVGFSFLVLLRCVFSVLLYMLPVHLYHSCFFLSLFTSFHTMKTFSSLFHLKFHETSTSKISRELWTVTRWPH